MAESVLLRGRAGTCNGGGRQCLPFRNPSLGMHYPAPGFLRCNCWHVGRLRPPGGAKVEGSRPEASTPRILLCRRPQYTCTQLRSPSAIGVAEPCTARLMAQLE